MSSVSPSIPSTWPRTRSSRSSGGRSLGTGLTSSTGDRSLQPLGYLAWAACGKDPGFTPAGILAHAGRASHYSQAEIDELAFDGLSPRADALSRAWHAALDQARQLVDLLPADRAGTAVLDAEGQLLRAGPTELAAALATGTLQLHEGRIRGAWPRVREP